MPWLQAPNRNAFRRFSPSDILEQCARSPVDDLVLISRLEINANEVYSGEADTIYPEDGKVVPEIAKQACETGSLP